MSIIKNNVRCIVSVQYKNLEDALLKLNEEMVGLIEEGWREHGNMNIGINNYEYYIIQVLHPQFVK